jgi:periplasmic copper chaperone A
VPLRRSRLRPLLLVVALTGLLAGCGPGGDPDLDVAPGQAAEPVAGSSQIVLTVTNRGDGDDRLLGAATPAALDVEVHLTEIEDGRATMAILDEVAIPAGETVRFRPGGLHLMLVVPDETVTEGGTFELTLRFDRSGEITVPVEVVDLLDLTEPDEDADDTVDADDPD